MLDYDQKFHNGKWCYLVPRCDTKACLGMKWAGIKDREINDV